jgi:kanamycin kinase
MVTAALPGRNAVDAHWIPNPAVAVAALGRGLRALHDALPVAECPFSWSAGARVEDIHRRADAGEPVDPWNPTRLGMDRVTALRRIDATPPADRLVVCHGDACAPNTLLGDDGVCSGHVDLGSLGVGDRWADLAVATWSCDWNYGPGWDATLLDAYGVDPDPERTAYYRILWDLDP